MCTEFSDFKGYKTRMAVVHMGGGLKSRTNMVTNVVTIDSNKGLMVFGKGNGRVHVEDVTIYGSKDMPNKDCFGSSPGCFACTGKAGI